MSNKPRAAIAWVVNKGGHNYTDAERFGRLMPITTGTINPFNTDRLALLVSYRIKEADPNDFVVISGMPILNMIVAILWMARFEQMNVLQWSTTGNRYELRVFDKDTLTEMVRGDDLEVAP